MVKILAALPILNSSGATKKVAALQARVSRSGASHSSGYADTTPGGGDPQTRSLSVEKNEKTSRT